MANGVGKLQWLRRLLGGEGAACEGRQDVNYCLYIESHPGAAAGRAEGGQGVPVLLLESDHPFRCAEVRHGSEHAGRQRRSAGTLRLSKRCANP